METRPKKLLDPVRDAIRLKHYSYRTKQAYAGWTRRYTLLLDRQYPFTLYTYMLNRGGRGVRTINISDVLVRPNDTKHFAPLQNK